VRVKILLALLPRHLRQNFSVLNKQQPVLKVARVRAIASALSQTWAISKNAPRIAVWYSIMVPALLFA
jgi:hypothetical protein